MVAPNCSGQVKVLYFLLEKAHYAGGFVTKTFQIHNDAPLSINTAMEHHSPSHKPVITVSVPIKKITSVKLNYVGNFLVDTLNNITVPTCQT